MGKIRRSKYDLPSLEKHWHVMNSKFETENADWIQAFSNLMTLVSDVVQRFEGHRSLPENCCYLLLAKSMNHSLSSFILLKSGMMIDSALCARNAIETLLMLEFFIKDKSVNHFELWIGGKNYRPVEVRKKLADLNEAKVGEVTITSDSQYIDLVKTIYDLLSRITHPNFESLHHILEIREENSFVMFIGGTLDGQSSLTTLIFASLSHYLLATCVLCSIVYDSSFFMSSKARFFQQKASLDKVMKKLM